MAKSTTISVIGGNGEQTEEKPKGVYTLDEALEETKIGKCQALLIVLTGLALMGAVLENINVSFILPYAKCDLKLTTSQQGILSSISFLGIVFTSHFWGCIADIWGRQKVIRVAVCGGFVFSTMSAFAANTYVLIAFRFFAGAFLAGVQAGAFSYISEFHTQKKSSVAASLISVFMSATWIYMSSLAILVIPMDWSIRIFYLDFKPWRLFLICNSLLNLWNGIAFSLLPESPKFLIAANRKEEALQVLSRIFAINTGRSRKEYPVKDIEFISIGNNNGGSKKGGCNIFQVLWSQTKPIFKPPLISHTWKLCYICFVIFSIGHGTFMWFPDFLTQVQNYNGNNATLCQIVGKKHSSNGFDDVCNIDNKNTTIFHVMFLVGIFFIVISTSSSLCMKIIEPKKLVGGWLLVSMAAGYYLTYVTGFYPIFVVFNIFLSCCTVANIVMAVAVNLYPIQYRAMATSFVFMCGRIGGVAGSNIVAMMLENNCDMIFYVFSAVLVTCSLIFMLVKTNTKVTPTQDVETK